MSAPKSLPRPTFWALLVAVVLVFLVFGGQVLSNPFRIDGAVFTSYLAIPPLVLLASLVHRRLSFVGFSLDVLELGCFKFVITYAIAVAMWAARGHPELPPRPSAPSLPVVRAPVVPTPIAPERRARVAGRVIDPNGAPVREAAVWISDGLADLVFAAPTSTASITHDGRRFGAKLYLVQERQPLSTRATDGRLHTFLDTYPVLPSGSRTLRIRHALGLVPIRCGVHPDQHEDEPSHLLVLHHPYAALSDASGAFALDGVPAGELTLSAWGPDRVRTDLRFTLAPREDHRVELVLDSQEAP